MNRVFVDMDGVIVDFNAYAEANGLTGDEVKKQRGAYLAMPPIAGATEGVRSLIGMGYAVWIATKPPTGISWAYADKAAWVFLNLPELKRRIIMTHNKGLLGDKGDFLIDDRPHKANCELFAGTLLPFVDGITWADVLNQFRNIQSPKLIGFLLGEIQMVKTERQAEIIAGNLVKEALWQGEWTAYRKLIGFLHEQSGDDTYLGLLNEMSGIYS